jgi:hypothetical protein
VDEDDFPAGRKDEVWRAWQIAPVQAIPETKSVQEAAHYQLGSGIDLSDARHALRLCQPGAGPGWTPLQVALLLAHAASTALRWPSDRSAAGAQINRPIPVFPASSGAVRRPHLMRGAAEPVKQGLLWGWAPEPFLPYAKDRHPDGPKPWPLRSVMGSGRSLEPGPCPRQGAQHFEIRHNCVPRIPESVYFQRVICALFINMLVCVL